MSLTASRNIAVEMVGGCAGRGLNPRPEGYIRAKAEEETTEDNKEFFSEGGTTNLKAMENIRRGWIVPVGGETPDRLC